MLADIKPFIKPVTRETVPDTPEEIAQVEVDFSILPEVYKNLLLEYGLFGFRGYADLTGGAIDDLTVFICYGAGSQHTIYSLQNGIEEVFRNRWTPFARDEYGSIYALDRDDATIWFFDIEEGFTPTKVFSSMQTFLDAIIVKPF